MEYDWNEIKIFVDIAQFGGLTSATQKTGLSAATLGRRINGLEVRIGRKLFDRTQTGYTLTESGNELHQYADQVNLAMTNLIDWHNGDNHNRQVRVSAGQWTNLFLTKNIDQLWQSNDLENPINLELLSANHMVDIGRKNADIGIRNKRPTQTGLAGKRIGRVCSALFKAKSAIDPILYIGQASDVNTASANWTRKYHADKVRLVVNSATNVTELIAAGMGIGVLPCFIGDSDPRLARASDINRLINP